MSDHAIVPTSTDALAVIGQMANGYAAQNVFADYRQRRAANTLRRQRADLDLFARFLGEVQHTTSGDELANSPDAWQGISWGLVQGFVGWMANQGYAVGSINVRLSTVKRYVGLAFKAGAIDSTEHALIKAVTGYSRNDGKHVDEGRAAADVPTRKGVKKATNVTLSTAQRRALKAQPDTPQGRRDTLLICLLLDHGLRCGEAALLKVSDFNLTTGQMTFYRPKVDKVQTHDLTKDTRAALKAYASDMPFAADAPLFRGSRKGKGDDRPLTDERMSERAITKRVELLGERIGVHGLSAHDARHSWATAHARKGVDPFRLQEAGGWNSLAMPRRYVDDARIANEGMDIDDGKPEPTASR